MGSRQITTAFVAAMCLLTACTAKVGTPTGATPNRKPPKSAASDDRAVNPANPANPVNSAALLTGAARLVPSSGPVVNLVGKIKLISDQGAGLISDRGGAIIAGNTAGIISNNSGGIVSNNSGGIVSNNAGGIVSNNAGGLISDNGGAIVGKTKYALTQTDEAPVALEFLLADADVTIHDAAGNQLVDGAGKPIAARSDGQGGYQIASRLPAGNLVLKVKLWNGGELQAILAQGETNAREVGIDTSTTLGANYVLTRFVKGDQKTFDKLPASEAERLRRELDVARPFVTRAPEYATDALNALADVLREKAPAVDKTLADIEVLLLGGLGDGKPADQVALNQPYALGLAADGTLYIGEGSFGRVRTVSPQGLLTTLMDGTGGKIAHNVPDLVDLALAPDGTFYVLSEGNRRATRVKPTGEHVVIAGGGTDTGLANGQLATALSLEPRSLALGPDGALYLGEKGATRIVVVAPDGTATQFATPAWGAGGTIAALTVAPDGSLYALREFGAKGSLWVRSKAGAWTELAAGLQVGDGDLALGADGAIYYIEDRGKRVSRRAPDGTTTLIVGEGVADTPPFVTPVAVAVAPDGTMYLADRRTNLVHARNSAGVWRLVAGATGEAQTSDGYLALNSPTGLGFDKAGTMYVAEGAGHGIKKYDGKTLTLVAGGVKGNSGDGGPALQARFDTPGAVTFRGDEMIVLDSRNFRIRAVGPDGTVRALVGHAGEPDKTPLSAGVPRPAAQHFIKGGTCLATGPDGLLYFAASGGHQVARLRADGQVELVAGRPYAQGEKPDEVGDGGEAGLAGLTAPLGIAFNPQGDLIITDTGNLRMRKVTGLAPGGTPRIEHFAGLARMETVGKLFGLTPGWEMAEEGAPAASTMIVGPAAVCFDAAGNLYVTEVGTANVAALTMEGDSVDTEAGLDLNLLPPVQPRVRKITPDGKIYTVGGPGAPIFDPAKGEGLGLPLGIAIDPQGRLVVVDSRENSLRLVPKGGY